MKKSIAQALAKAAETSKPVTVKRAPWDRKEG